MIHIYIYISDILETKVTKITIMGHAFYSIVPFVWYIDDEIYTVNFNKYVVIL